MPLSSDQMHDSELQDYGKASFQSIIIDVTLLYMERDENNLEMQGVELDRTYCEKRMFVSFALNLPSRYCLLGDWRFLCIC